MDQSCPGFPYRFIGLNLGSECGTGLPGGISLQIRVDFGHIFSCGLKLTKNNYFLNSAIHAHDPSVRLSA